MAFARFFYLAPLLGPSGWLLSAPQQAWGHPCTAQPCTGSLALGKADVPLLAGPCPIETSGTRSHFTLTDCPEEGTWSAVLQQQDGAVLCVSLCSPSSARVGRYRLTLEASTEYQGSSFHLGDFVLLFNAWHPGEALAFLTPERSQGSFPSLQIPAAGLSPFLCSGHSSSYWHPVPDVPSSSSWRGKGSWELPDTQQCRRQHADLLEVNYSWQLAVICSHPSPAPGTALRSPMLTLAEGPIS